ncbi:hypothetical protein HZB93_02805 [Candidatus Falkowbacteria bacterium]|nr:hypothetical protein [Candidatus Falkowbacteria bacterium]
MDLGKGVEELRKMFGSVVNLALMPVRLPGALADFVWQTFSHWWNEWQENKKGSVASIMPWPPGGFYDPRQHH